MNDLALIRVRLTGAPRPSWAPVWPARESLEIPFRSSAGSPSLPRRLRDALMGAVSKWAYVSLDFVHPESAFEEVLARLVTAGAASGAFALTRGDDDALSILDTAPSDIESALSPSFDRPSAAHLFTLFVFSRERLLEVLEEIDPGRGREEPSFAFVFSAVTAGAIPLGSEIAVRKELCPEALAARSLDLFQRGESLPALEMADYVGGNESLPPSLERARAEALAKNGQLLKAKISLERYLREHSDDARAQSLLAFINDEVRPYGLLEYADFERALGHIPSSANKEEEKVLVDLVRSLPPDGSVLEIGCGEGRFSALMALAMLGSRCRLYVHDDFERRRVSGAGEVEDVLRRNLALLRLPEIVTLMSGSLASALRSWAERPPLDAVIVHGAKSYEDAVTEISQAYAVLKEGSYLLMYGVTPANPGRWRVWREYLLSMLGNPQQLGALAFGRKQRGVPFPAKPLRPFSYSRELVRVMRETRPDLAGLADALDMTTSPNASSAQLEWAERLIAKMPGEIKRDIRAMVDADGGEDPWLRYWRILSETEQGATTGEIGEQLDVLLSMKLPGTLLRLRALQMKEARDSDRPGPRRPRPRKIP